MAKAQQDRRLETDRRWMAINLLLPTILALATLLAMLSQSRTALELIEILFLIWGVIFVAVELRGPNGGQG